MDIFRGNMVESSKYIIGVDHILAVYPQFFLFHPNFCPLFFLIRPVARENRAEIIALIKINVTKGFSGN